MLRLAYFLFGLLIALPVFAESDLPWKNYDSLHNSLEVVTFNDTVYDVDLPSIELKTGTYHNYGDATTVGFKLIVRGDRIEFKDALFYKEDPDAEVKSPMRPKEPFHFEIDNSTESNRIDHVYIQLKFPFSAYFSVDDSLVLITDKGDYTLYMGEDRRAEAKYRPILNRLNDELSVKDNELVEAKSINHVFVTGLIAVITLSVLACSVIIYIARKKRVKQATEMNRLLCLISENEMDNRRLKVAVSDLMRKHFDTINRLCGDYFEMADTPALKKIIYNKVEAEINRLKEAKNIKALEQTINQYCDNVMVRIDEQLPELSEKERLLLIYLYSGMSARTICVLTDIQLKNFYMRRQRLKSKILASDAPDKEYFAEMM